MPVSQVSTPGMWSFPLQFVSHHLRFHAAVALPAALRLSIDAAGAVCPFRSIRIYAQFALPDLRMCRTLPCVPRRARFSNASIRSSCVTLTREISLLITPSTACPSARKGELMHTSCPTAIRSSRPYLPVAAIALAGAVLLFSQFSRLPTYRPGSVSNIEAKLYLCYSCRHNS